MKNAAGFLLACGALAAVALAKLASLLPAALVLRTGKSEAMLFARRGDLAVIEAAAVEGRVHDQAAPQQL